MLEMSTFSTKESDFTSHCRTYAPIWHITGFILQSESLKQNSHDGERVNHGSGI